MQKRVNAIVHMCLVVDVVLQGSVEATLEGVKDGVAACLEDYSGVALLTDAHSQARVYEDSDAWLADTPQNAVGNKPCL